MTTHSAISVPSPSRRRWAAFLLKPVESRVARYSVEQSGNIRRLFDAAVMRDEAAHALLDHDDLPLAIELVRASAEFYVRAFLASELSSDELSDLTTEAAWKEFDRLRKAPGFPPTPADFEVVRAFLSAADPLTLARLPVEEALAKARSFGPALKWLKGLIEPRSLAEIKHQRWRRIICTTVAVVGLSWWGLYAVFAPRNLALHQPVTMSSTHAQSTATIGALVDGTIDQAYGAHTGNDSPPWVMVDLGRSQKIGRIKIYNRGDGWFDETLPLALELSEDGVNFVEVDRRTTSFGQVPPWSFRAKGRSARYVRVLGKPGGLVVLSELEVYGQ